jgi:hypothetical protein
MKARPGPYRRDNASMREPIASGARGPDRPSHRCADRDPPATASCRVHQRRRCDVCRRSRDPFTPAALGARRERGLDPRIVIDS